MNFRNLSEEDYQAIADRINHDNHFLQSSRMRVTHISDGSATVEMDIDEQILNIYGLVHGGALYALCDTAAGAASFTSGKDAVTLNSSINYIRPGRGGKLIATATRVHSGKTVGVYEVFLFNDEEVLLSRATFTMFFLDDEHRMDHTMAREEERRLKRELESAHKQKEDHYE